MDLDINCFGCLLATSEIKEFCKDSSILTVKVKCRVARKSLALNNYNIRVEFVIEGGHLEIHISVIFMFILKSFTLL